MKRKSLLIIAMTLILATFVNMFAGMTVFADTDTTEFTEISTPDELKAITDLTANYKLTADIDLSDTDGNQTAWTPFGAFSGTFDGNGYTISGFLVSETTTTSAGLFSEVSKGGTVKNLTIANATLYTSTSTYNLGAIAGLLNGEITNCKTESDVLVAKAGNQAIWKTVAVGGIVGCCGSDQNTITARVSHCINNAEVKINYHCTSNPGYAGGITGLLDYAVSIENCVNNGAVTISNFSDTDKIKGDSQIACGGIVGGTDVYRATKGNIINCINFADVSALVIKNSACAGGIIGTFGSTVTTREIKNNYNFGTAYGNGSSTDSNSAYVGQLIGRIRKTYVGDANYSVGDTLYGTANATSSGLNTATEAEMKAQGVYQSIITKELSTAEELELFARSFSTTYVYKLKNDIDLGGANWTPVESFGGTFDGNGYTVSNFAVANTTTINAGFFSEVTTTGIVKNLTIANATIFTSTSSYQVGGIAGTVTGTIFGCKTEDNVTVTTHTTENKVGYHAAELTIGGIVGKTPDGCAGGIFYCENNASVAMNYNKNSTGGTNAGYIGGIVGRSTNGSTSYCINNGNVFVSSNVAKGNKETAAGGIAGRFGSWGSYTIKMEYCVNNGTITNNSTGGGASVAGLFGYAVGGANKDDKVISCNYNFGTIGGSCANVAQLIGIQANDYTSTNNYGVTDNGVLYGSTVTFGGMSSDTEANLKASATYASIINAIKENNSAFEAITTEYVGYQTSALSGGKFDVRFIGTFSGYFTDDYTKCDNVGFKISLSYTDTDGTPHNLSPEGGVVTRTTMYSSILATDGQGNEGTTTHTAKSLGGDYIFVMVCKGLPAEVKEGTDITVTIQTFYTPIGSDPVYGEEMTITVTAPADTLA